MCELYVSAHIFLNVLCCPYTYSNWLFKCFKCLHLSTFVFVVLFIEYVHVAFIDAVVNCVKIQQISEVLIMMLIIHLKYNGLKITHTDQWFHSFLAYKY